MTSDSEIPNPTRSGLLAVKHKKYGNANHIKTLSQSGNSLGAVSSHYAICYIPIRQKLSSQFRNNHPLQSSNQAQLGSQHFPISASRGRNYTIGYPKIIQYVKIIFFPALNSPFLRSGRVLVWYRKLVKHVFATRLLARRHSRVVFASAELDALCELPFGTAPS